MSCPRETLVEKCSKHRRAKSVRFSLRPAWARTMGSSLERRHTYSRFATGAVFNLVIGGNGGAARGEIPVSTCSAWVNSSGVADHEMAPEW
jgi:hypothetical protein